MKKIILMISIFFLCLNYVNANEVVKYAACVDGDTIKVYINNEEKTVRLLAVDTPESVKPETEIAYYGKEASEYTCKRIKKAKKIVLEYDPNSDKKDKFDRLLAWVFLDDQLLQSDLVSNGYAKVAYLYDDYKYTDMLIKNQELASAKEIGIWNSEARKKYENNSRVEDMEDEKYENYEVVIITIILLLVTFVFGHLKK